MMMETSSKFHTKLGWYKVGKGVKRKCEEMESPLSNSILVQNAFKILANRLTVTNSFH